jgi:biopolymer transport protein ExbD
MRIDLREDEAVEVQMAPLIDCVFLLLVFFLVATTLKKIDDELPLILPKSDASIEVKQPEDFMVVSIDMDEGFYIDGTPVSLSILQNNLREKAQTNPEAKIRLDVHEEVRFQRVMQVYDILKFEGLNNVGINTRQEEWDAPER